jgi:predicted dithiol-disulfide oxidoreductase (DUF899 family)
MCTMMIDGFNGVAFHLAQNVDFAIVAAAEPAALRAPARGEDLTIPVYNLLDLTPAGRGDFYARLDYGVDVHWGAYPPAS